MEVRSRVDGSSVKSKLEAALSGGETITPETLAATPGTLAYKAPNKQNAQATITLTATSRRGIAKLKLAATTGGTDWTVDRVVPGGTWKGTKCDGLSGTWEIRMDVKAPGATIHQLFKVTIAAEPDADTGEGTFTYDSDFVSKAMAPPPGLEPGDGHGKRGEEASGRLCGDVPERDGALRLGQGNGGGQDLHDAEGDPSRWSTGRSPGSPRHARREARALTRTSRRGGAVVS